MLLSKICIFLVLQRANTHFQEFLKCQLLQKPISKGFQPWSLLAVREQLALLECCCSAVGSVLARQRRKCYRSQNQFFITILTWLILLKYSGFSGWIILVNIYTHTYRNKNKILVNVSKPKKPTVAI